MVSADAPAARIVLGYDGSEDSLVALRRACLEAIERSAELVILHSVDDTVLNSAWGVVFDPEAIRLAATDLVDGAVTEATNAGLPFQRIKTAVELGNPAAALVRHSDQAELVVLGRRSVARAAQAFVGSTAAGVAGAANCPVMVVGADSPEPAADAPIGVAVNTAAQGGSALEWGLREAARKQVGLRVLSVCRAPQSRFFRSGAPSPEQQAAAISVTTERVEALIAPLVAGYPQVPVDLEVGYGNPLDVLVARSSELAALVVHVQTSFPTFSVGGLVRGLLAHAACPVVTLRVGGDAAP